MLYTIGYAGWTPALLYAAVSARQAVLCDIRYRPYSKNPAYRQPALQAALGPRYAHIAALGNRNYRGGPVDIVDYAAGLRLVSDLLSQWPAVILMCACANVETCHRLGVSAQLGRDLGQKVEHLERRRDDQLTLW